MTRVTDFLKKGRSNAISGKKLAILMGYSDTRTLRHEIERERREGAVILSAQGIGGGYFLPGSSQELDEYINEQSKRALTTFAVLRSAKRFRRLMQAGQMYMTALKKPEDSADGKTGCNVLL